MREPSMRFDGKVGIVTGSGSGIGRATAIGFAARGGTVVIADINEENARKVEREILDAGGRATAISIDVTKTADIDRMIADTSRRFGRIDFLHNNAFGLPATAQTSTQAAGRLADVEESVWAYMIDVGLTAVWRAMKRVLPLMRAQGSGAIVNTASISGLRADYGIAAYNAAKAGVINLTRVGAIEYARDGVRVNCICPGLIDTEMADWIRHDEAAMAQFDASAPAGRIGSPAEIAGAVSFLASDAASYLQGSVLMVDGGVTA